MTNNRCQDPPDGIFWIVSNLSGFSVDTANSTGAGPVRIRYFEQDGYMCTKHFDDLDATVVCKELGFLGGFAYRYR